MSSILEGVNPLILLPQMGEKGWNFTGFLFQNLTESISANVCGENAAEGEGCRDERMALILKAIAVASILIAGILGIAIPLVGKSRRFLHTDSNLFVTMKAFAAGVILATGFVHILPDATSALTDPCLPKYPWSKFPFSGFIAMMAALATLLADVLGTQYYEKKHEKQNQKAQCESMDIDLESEIPSVPSTVRHVVVSQVLELGIVSHSLIIGISLGVSLSPCTIRPLIGALSFHQFFEGFALGGCIAQAKFHAFRSTIMACFFAITTPMGIVIGTCISSIYNSNSPRALVIEGVFDSISAGILVYMALVDLIAADFLSKKMSNSKVKLQVASYFSLFLGAGLMSCLAIWA